MGSKNIIYSIFFVKVLVYDLIKLFFHQERKGNGNMISLDSNYFS